MGLNTNNKLKTLEYLVGVDTDTYTVYAISPVAADVSNPEERAAMAEFICRANYGMRYGNFELDLRDGEIRYPLRPSSRTASTCPPSPFPITPPASLPSSSTAPAQRKPSRCAARRRDERITVFSLG